MQDPSKAHTVPQNPFLSCGIFLIFALARTRRWRCFSFSCRWTRWCLEEYDRPDRPSRGARRPALSARKIRAPRPAVAVHLSGAVQAAVSWWSSSNGAGAGKCSRGARRWSPGGDSMRLAEETHGTRRSSSSSRPEAGGARGGARGPRGWGHGPRDVDGGEAERLGKAAAGATGRAPPARRRRRRRRWRTTPRQDFRIGGRLRAALRWTLERTTRGTTGSPVRARSPLPRLRPPPPPLCRRG